MLYERAVKEIPGSYKLWKRYLDTRRTDVKGLHPVNNADDYNQVNDCFERSFVLLNKVSPSFNVRCHGYGLII